MSWPHTVTSPSLGGMTPASTRIVVDLPAPLRPSSAVAAPGATEKSMPRTASTSPNLTQSDRTSTTGGGRRSMARECLGREAVTRRIAGSLGAGFARSHAKRCFPSLQSTGSTSFTRYQVELGQARQKRSPFSAFSTRLAGGLEPLAVLRGQLLGPGDEGLEPVPAGPS